MAGKKGRYELGVEISGKVNSSLSRSVGEAENMVDHLRADLNSASKDLSKLFGSIDSRGLDMLAGSADKVFGGIVADAKASAAGLTAVLGGSYGYGTSFEKQMSTVQAISQAGEADMRKLKKAAQDMGRQTQFSATEAGQAEEYMAMAGWKAAEMVAGLPGIMNLAAASGEELGMTSDIVTDALTAFGLTAKDSAMFADVLAQASSNSNTNVSLMGETFQYAAPAAGAMGYSVQDLAVSIGLMANAGIKGSQAGTALRSTITRLAKPTKESKKAMEALGLSIANTDGSMKSWADITGQIRSGMQRFTADQKASYAAMLGGQEAMSGLLAIVNASEEDYRKLTEAIQDSNGAAERMANVRIDNLAGDVTLLKSAVEGAGIAIYEGLETPSREVVQGITEAANAFTESKFLEELERRIPTVRRELKEFASNSSEAFGPLLKAGTWMADHPQVISGTLTGIGSALLTFKVAKAASGLPAVIASLSGLIGAWPVAAAGVVIGGIAGIGMAVRTTNRRMLRENLAGHFGDISLSVKELKEAARGLLQSRALEQIGNAFDQFGKAEELARSVKESVEEIEKAHWKVGIGLELSESDKENYKDSIEAFIHDSKEQTIQTRLSMELNLEGLAGDSTKGEKLKDQFSQFYSSQYDELTRLGDELGKVVSDAFEDGMLDIDETRAITELQEKMSRITQALAISESDARMQVISDSYAGKLDADSFQNLQTELKEQAKESEKQLQESLTYGYAGLNAQFNAGAITQDEYNSQKDFLYSQYLSRNAEVQSRAITYQVEAIRKQYQEELAAAEPMIREEMDQLLKETLDWIQGGAFAEGEWTSYVGQMKDIWKKAGIDSSTQAAIAELFEPLKESLGTLGEIRGELEEKGAEIPKALSDALSDSAGLGLIAGNADAIIRSTAEYVAESPETAELVLASTEQGGKIPEAIAKGILSAEKQAKIAEAIKNTEDYINRAVASMNISGDIHTDFNAGGNSSSSAALNRTALNSYAIAHHASGGLITRPTLSYFAENGPEMAIPIDGSERARLLWAETGKLLDVYRDENYGRYNETLLEASPSMARTLPQTGGSSFSPTFSPIQNFYGNTSREDVTEANRESFEQFTEYMERFLMERARVGF